MRTQPPDFAYTVLDALTAHIAVLDEQGVIVGVNQAWRRFAEHNGGESRRYYVGQNYLAVCEAPACAGGMVDGTAQALVHGLRAVLRGEQESYLLEYPCHSPDRQRWFIVHVTRCQHRNHPRIVVAHEDITARRLAEEQLRQARDALERANQDLRQALVREQHMASTDELTGIHNRRHFFVLAAQQFDVAQRYGRPLSLIMFDLDHFKAVNDRHGHQGGDLCLQHVAGIASRHLRDADVLARYGGEEFVVLLPDTGPQQARVLAERIRAAVSEQAIRGERGRIELSISAGIAGIEDADGRLERMIRHADEALYAAKAAGRDRVMVHAPGPSPALRPDTEPGLASQLRADPG